MKESNINILGDKFSLSTSYLSVFHRLTYTVPTDLMLDIQWDLCLLFPDPSFNFYGPWANPISTMAPTSIVFPDPLFLFQTPNENDE
jgi:hypothetical protein